MVFFDKITDLDKGDVTDHICLNFSEKKKRYQVMIGNFQQILRNLGLSKKWKKMKGSKLEGRWEMVMLKKIEGKLSIV